MLIARNSYRILNLIGPYIRFAALFIIMLSVGMSQTRQDLELLKSLANQQRQEIITEAETVKIPEEVGPTMTEVDLPEPDPKSSHFGYSFFTPSKSIALLNNLPAPTDYVLGPGDEVVITLWGETELVSSHDISRTGTIYVERIGLVHLAGKTISEAEILVKGKLESAYSTLRGSRPKTFFDFSLGELKTINVKFVGEIKAPGLYPIHPFSTVTTGLMQAGGVDTTGSLRNIQIIRNGEVVSSMDLYAFLLKGRDDGDARLQDQDVVFVPVRESDINISGEVRRPGTYEMKETESLIELITYAGGLKPTARSPLMVRRIDPLNSRRSEDTPRSSFSISVSDLMNWNCQTGDSVYVPFLLPEEKEISVRGQVKKPGIYVYQDSMTILDALRMAGGIDDPGFLPSMHLERGEILRKNSEGDHAIIQPFNLGELLSGDGAQNITLQNYDIIVVRRAEFFHAPEEVTILGEVIVPGVYSIRENDESLESIITRAGGFSERAFPDGIIMNRDSVRVISTDDQIAVMAGDEIIVPRKPGTVEVMGEVYNPGLIHYDRRMSLKEYIEYAGGFTNEANTGNVSVIYPSGDVKIKGWFGSPKVVEGSLIVVHREPDHEPFNYTEFLSETASIVASLATIFFIISSK